MLSFSLPCADDVQQHRVRRTGPTRGCVFPSPRCSALSVCPTTPRTRCPPSRSLWPLRILVSCHETGPERPLTSLSVPVYDARRARSFDFQNDLRRLATVLPAWSQGEIPFGSFVVVGHTLSVYRANAGNWTLGCNLLWVIVVGTPED